jgi:hypothetical protein
MNVERKTIEVVKKKATRIDACGVDEQRAATAIRQMWHAKEVAL